MVLDDEAFEIPVSLFESSELPEHWDRLDEFEGEGYQRVVAKITVDGEIVEAFLYAAVNLLR